MKRIITFVLVALVLVTMCVSCKNTPPAEDFDAVIAALPTSDPNKPILTPQTGKKDDNKSNKELEAKMVSVLCSYAISLRSFDVSQPEFAWYAAYCLLANYGRVDFNAAQVAEGGTVSIGTKLKLTRAEMMNLQHTMLPTLAPQEFVELPSGCSWFTYENGEYIVSSEHETECEAELTAFESLGEHYTAAVSTTTSAGTVVFSLELSTNLFSTTPYPLAVNAATSAGA